MDLYQWIFFILKLMGLVLFAFITCSFSIGIYQSAEIYIKKFSSLAVQKGWKEALKSFSLEILHSFFSFFLLLSFICLCPLGYLISKHFVTDVLIGKMTTSQFIQRLPEINSSIAVFYSSSIKSIFSLLQRLFV
jgi:hypothetical protein